MRTTPTATFSPRSRHIATAYMIAKEAVIESGYAHEVDWQECVALDNLTERAFLREAAWVILSAGMSETVVRSKFPEVSKAFLYWSSGAAIIRRRAECRRDALVVFANARKVDAILNIASVVSEEGFDRIRGLIRQEGVGFIERLPFMGPATKYHLAKNLGVAVAKPDRHLLRVAECVGYPSPAVLCHDIAEVVGDKVSVVDLVIWRYATLDREYLRLFRGGDEPRGPYCGRPALRPRRHLHASGRSDRDLNREAKGYS